MGTSFPILLGVLILLHAEVHAQSLYGEAQDDFRPLCLILALPGRQTGPNAPEFLSTWNAQLAHAGAKFLASDDLATQLHKAEDRCNRTKAEMYCGYVELLNIGKLVYQDVQELSKSLISSGNPSNSWWYFAHYIAAWFQHPRMQELQCSPDLEYLWLFIAGQSKLGSYDTALRLKFVFDDQNAKGLRQEINKYCYFNTMKPICRLSTWTKTADKVGKLLNYVGRSNWEKPADQTRLTLDDGLKGAVYLHFYGVKVLFLHLNPQGDASDFLSTTEQEVKSWLKRVVFVTYDTLKNNKTADLVKVVELIPDNYELPCKHTDEYPSLDNSLCTFKTTIMPIKPFVNAYVHKKQSKGAIVRKLIQYSGVDYREYLTQMKLDRIMQNTDAIKHDLPLIAQHLQKTIQSGFGGMETYFKTMATFDYSKAKADVAYITGAIDRYKKSYQSIVHGLTVKCAVLIPLAIVGTTLDVVSSTIKLVTAIADNCNPLGWITGAADPVQLIEAADDLAQKITKLAQAIRIIPAFVKLIEATKTYMNGMMKNQNFWTSVSNVIKHLNGSTTKEGFEKDKNYFLKQYELYNPALTKADMVGVSEAWKLIVDELCDIIFETESMYASAIKGGVILSRICPDGRIEAEKLDVVLGEIYDFQFDLIDAMVDYMRAIASSKAAEAITSDFMSATSKLVGRPDIYSELELLAGFSMMCYKISVITSIKNYCDILEYTQGRRLDACNGLGTTITILLSTPLTKCTSTTEIYRSVPIKPSKKGDTAFLNAKDLYAGRTVTFQIPNREWLLEHNWMSTVGKDDVIYVRGFELFLPTVTQRRVKVLAMAGRTNQLNPPSGINYVLNPPRLLEFDYTVDHNGLCKQKLMNPYKHLTCEVMPGICVETTSAADAGTYRIYPSIYAYYYIRLFGYSEFSMPDTDFNITIGLNLCKIGQTFIPQVRNINVGMNSTTREEDERSSVATGTCCDNNMYTSPETKQCTTCPRGSEKRYGGLFCGNVTRLELAPQIANVTKYFTFEEAKAKCVNAGTTIASPDDIKKAVELGYDACACGWLSNESVKAPVPSPKCTTQGEEDTRTCVGRKKWDVYCLNRF